MIFPLTARSTLTGEVKIQQIHERNFYRSNDTHEEIQIKFEPID